MNLPGRPDPAIDIDIDADADDWEVNLELDRVTCLSRDIGFDVGLAPPPDYLHAGPSRARFVAELIQVPTRGELPSAEERQRLGEIAAALFVKHLLQMVARLFGETAVSTASLPERETQATE